MSQPRSPITTHVLDTSLGRPARGVAVVLEVRDIEGRSWRPLGEGRTDDDGRITDLLAADHPLLPGTYRLTFDVGAYYATRDTESFYGTIPLVFQVRATDEHYHVPLLLNPFGYSTYRGS
jgi:5-hydroxyisourate hydrolase